MHSLSVCCYELTHPGQEKSTPLKIILIGERDVKMLFVVSKLLYTNCSLQCDGDWGHTVGEGSDFTVT